MEMGSESTCLESEQIDERCGSAAMKLIPAITTDA
jgi:hypothetical protein